MVQDSCFINQQLIAKFSLICSQSLNLIFCCKTSNHPYTPAKQLNLESDHLLILSAYCGVGGIHGSQESINGTRFPKPRHPHLSTKGWHREPAPTVKLLWNIHQLPTMLALALTYNWLYIFVVSFLLLFLTFCFSLCFLLHMKLNRSALKKNAHWPMSAELDRFLGPKLVT